MRKQSRNARSFIARLLVAVVGVASLTISPLQLASPPALAASPEVDQYLALPDGVDSTLGDWDGLSSESSTHPVDSGGVIPDNADFTIEAWVHPDSLDNSSTYHQVFQQSGTNLSNYGRFGLNLKRLTETGFAGVQVIYDGINMDGLTEYPGVKVAIGRWTHIALSVDIQDASTAILTLYVDGVEVASETGNPVNDSIRTDKFTVGYLPFTPSGTTDRHFHGGIDQIKVWDGLLSEAQLQQSMNSFTSEAVASAPPLRMHLPMNGDFLDSTGNFLFSATGTTSLVELASTAITGSDSVVTFPRSYLTSSGGWSPPATVDALTYLIVGGGGAGSNGISYVHGGGGGGAGGFREGQLEVTGPLAVNVGAGGRSSSPGSSGGASTLGNISVPGGGGGGSYYVGPTAGASGGGAGHSNSSSYQTGASSTVSPPIYGSSGGSTSTTGYGQLFAGGGGGAGGPGSAGGTSASSGRGGVGKPSDITGLSIVYAGGGGAGGGQSATSRSLVQDGGGGRGGYYNGSTLNIDGLDGASGLGAGGGGGAGWWDGTNSGSGFGGNGGSGIVIVRFTTPTVPPAVSGFSATQRLIDSDSDADSVTLNWTAVTHTTAVTGYTIEWGTDQNYSNTPISVSGGSTTSHAVSGLSDGADYYFRIKAVNAVGSSASWATATSVAISNQDYALDFDNTVSDPATSTFVSSSDGTQVIPSNGNFTVEAWIKPDEFAQRTDNFYAIVTQNQDSGGTNDGRFFLSLHERGANGRYEIHVGSESNSGADMNYYVDVDHIIRAQEWAHIAVTSDATAQLWKLYVNGVLFYTSPANEFLSGTASNLAGFHIGSAGYRDANNPQWHYFNGQIDQVKVWDSALSGTQLVESMHSWGAADVTGAPTLLAHYDFNDFTNSSSLKDQAGSNDLTINNAAISDLKPLVEANTSNPAVVSYSFERSYLTAVGGWTVPTAPAKFNALVVGGGGGGAGNTSSNGLASAGSGGGGGVYNARGLSLSGTLPVVVGQGGIGGNTSADRTLTGGYQGQSSKLQTLIAGGGGGGGCLINVGTGIPCGSSERIHGLPGTASGSGGSSSNFWNAYNWGVAGTASSATLGGVTLPAISGFAGAPYDNSPGASTTGSSGSAGGAGGAGTYNTPGPGVSSTTPGISGTFGKGGASWGSADWSQSQLAPNTGAGGSGAGALNTYSASNGVTGSSGLVVVSYLIPSQNVLLDYNSTDTNSYDLAVDGSVTDLSANGINATAMNSIGLDATTHAWNFTGGAQASTPYIDVDDIATSLLREQGFTVDFEADFGAVNQGERIFDFAESAGNTNDSILVFRQGTTNDLEVHLRVGSSSAHVCEASNALQGLTGLHRYTISLDGTTCKMYRDGTEILSTAFPYLPTEGITYTSNYIGRSHWAEDNFTGQIRYIRFFKGAFTPSEIGAVSYKTVTLDASPGTVTDASLITSGSVRLPEPTRSQYTNEGWYTDLADSGTKKTSPFTPSADVTLLANWELSEYVVTWDSNGGSAVSDSTYISGGTITKPNDPTLAGKVFVGWASSETSNQGDLSSRITSWPYDPPTDAALTLYAMWLDACVPSNTSTYVGTGTGLANIDQATYGSVGQGYREYEFTGLDRCAFTIPAGTSSFYALVVGGGGTGGWGDRSGGGGAGELLVTQDPISASAGQVIVIDVGDGGDQVANNPEAGEDTIFDSYTAFGGGRGAASGSGATAGGSGGGLSSCLINAAGGTNASLSTDRYADFLEFGFPGGDRESTSCSGYDGGGGGGAGGPGGDGGAGTGGAAKVVFGRVLAGGGAAYASSGTVAGGAASGVTVGGTFNGASAGVDGTGSGAASNSTNTSGGSGLVVIRAAITTYSVTLTAGSSGSGSDLVLGKPQGATVTLPSSADANARFSRSGYTVIGWSTTDGGSQDYAFSASYSTEANVTLYPVWQQNTHEVTFNANDGTGTPATSSQTVNSSTATALNANAFTRTGYTFSGWNTQADGLGTDYADGASVTLVADLTLYAKWALVPNRYANFTSDNPGSGVTTGKSFKSSGVVLPTRTTMTVEVWFKEKTTSSGQNPIISQGSDTGAGGFALMVSGTNDSDRQLYIVENNWNSTGVSITKDRWYHLAYSVNNGNYTVFLDGVQVATGAVSPVSNSGIFYLGENYYYSAGTPRHVFHGYMDQVKIWSKALSISEVQTSMHARGDAGIGNLLNHYTFDDASNPGKDEAGSSNLTINGTGTDVTYSTFGLAIRTPSSGLTGEVGTAYSLPAFAPGGDGVKTFSITSGTLPAGLSLNSANGLISGTPTVAGDESVVLTVTDEASGTQSTSAFTISISAQLTNVGAPTGAATSQTLKSIDVSWTAVSNASSYTLKIYNAAGTTLLDTISLANSLTSYTVTAALGSFETIADGTTYKLSLTAVGTGNYVTSDESAKSSVTTLASFAVTYSANGATSGTAPASQVKVEGVSLQLATNSGTLARTGYTFAGWNTQGDGEGTDYAAGASYATDANLALFAKWSPDTFTITYNYNGADGGTQPATDSYTNGGTAVTLPTPTKSGYTFGGWYDNSGLTGTAVTSPYSPSADITLYAKWTGQTYTVNFSYYGADGGDSQASDTFTVGSGSPIVLPTPTKTGYTFAGWYAGAFATLAGAAGANYSPTQNLTLSAKWTAIQYTVTYNADIVVSGITYSGSGDVPVDANTYTIGATVPVLPNAQATPVTRLGYTFVGWVTNADGTGTALNSGQSLTMGSADVNLYPKWSANTYTISYNLNGGTGSLTGAPTTYTVGGNNVALPSSGFTKTGFDFIGWTKTQGSTTAISNSFSTFADVTLYAVWRLKTVNYTFDDGIADKSTLGITWPSNSSASFGSSITLPDLSGTLSSVGADQYLFFGWSLAGVDYAPGVSYTMGENTAAFVAEWVMVRDVRYSFNGGTHSGSGNQDAACLANNPQLCTVGQNISLRSNPSRAGYDFLGWKVQDKVTVKPGGASHVVLDDEYLFYAQWQAIDYTISFNSVGGSNNFADVTKNIGEVLTLPNPGAKPHHSFAGWTNDSGVTLLSPNASFVVGASSEAFEAVWTPNQYRVVYDWQGAVGTPEADGQYTFGSGDMTLPAQGDRVRDGFNFAGWSTSPSGAIVSGFQPTSDTVLYAQWSNGNYSLTFVPKGGTMVSTSASVPRGSSLQLPTPVRTGFVFTGWYDAATNGNKIGAGGAQVSIGGSGSLYAGWVQRSLYGVDEASLESSQIYTASDLNAIDTTLTHGPSSSSARVQIPAGSLTAGTKIDVRFFRDNQRQQSLINNQNSYVLSVMVSWLYGSGDSATVPDTDPNKPITVTLSNSQIKEGAMIYKVIGDQITELGRAQSDGVVTVELFEDPEIVIAITAPDAPQSVTATPGDQKATVSWSAPASNGGDTITGYTVTANTGETCTWISGPLSCEVTGLTNGTNYTFSVVATNSIGDSATATATATPVAASSGSSSASPTPTTPGPATGIDAVSGQSWVWTKRIATNQVKVYIKFPEMGANYQINLQKNDGDYTRKMSKTINTTSDTDLRVVGEWYYLVRTITLPGEGRYRIEVTQDGQRVTLNGQDRPAVYSYR